MRVPGFLLSGDCIDVPLPVYMLGGLSISSLLRPL